MKEKEVKNKQEVKYSEKSKFIEFNITQFSAVRLYKSIARAIRRGKVWEDGTPLPKRPYNNRLDKSRKGNSYNSLRRKIYGRIKPAGV